MSDKENAENPGNHQNTQQSVDNITDDMLVSTPFRTTATSLNPQHMQHYLRQHSPSLNEIWGAPLVDPSLITALGQAGDIRRIKNGLAFDLPDGRTLEWRRDRSLVQSIKAASKSLKALFKRAAGRGGEAAAARAQSPVLKQPVASMKLHDSFNKTASSNHRVSVEGTLIDYTGPHTHMDWPFYFCRLQLDTGERIQASVSNWNQGLEAGQRVRGEALVSGIFADHVHIDTLEPAAPPSPPSLLSRLRGALERQLRR